MQGFPAQLLGDMLEGGEDVRGEVVGVEDGCAGLEGGGYSLFESEGHCVCE